MANASAADVMVELHRFGLARDRFRAAMVTVLGVGLTEVDALEYLERFGPMTQRELGGHLALTSGAVTMLVDRLVDRGLARRSAHPTDRRASLVELLPSRRLPKVPEIDGYHEALVAAAGRLSSGDRAVVAQFLRSAAAEAAQAAASMRARNTATAQSST